MKPFQGFPARMDFTPIPNLFLNRLLPQISDIAELKTTLYIFTSIYGKKGYPRFVSSGELLNNPRLMQSFGKTDKQAEDALRKALGSAIKRGTLLRLTVKTKNGSDEIYFLNTQSDRRAIQSIESGDFDISGFELKTKTTGQTEDLPDIFTLYEENIGALTPIIADELKEAEKLYPEIWIQDAIKKAANQNKRNWSYIVAILERWSTEGKDDGAYKRDNEKESQQKYAKQRYGHMVQR